MLRLLSFAAALLTLASAARPADNSTPPKIDKQKLETYLRYMDGYTPQVKFTIDDPTPSAFHGYFRLIVHLALADRKVGDKVYYTADGERFLSGQLWELGENPFLDTEEHMLADGPSFGPANAKVTIVVYSDFQCPYCREFAKTLRTNIPQKYPNDVRVIFQDFPIESIHPWALAASEAAHCIADQRPAAFWDFHDWIFEHQQEVNAGNLKEKTLDLAKQQNLDVGKVTACIDAHATAQVVNASISAGRALQIQQTPTAFVNGRQIGGALPWPSLNAVIQLELNRPKEIPPPTLESKK